MECFGSLAGIRNLARFVVAGRFSCLSTWRRRAAAVTPPQLCADVRHPLVPGLLGLKPPKGEGRNLTGLTRIYSGRAMQRIVGGLIALGMIGWSGFNLALGGAALGRLVGFPHWVGRTDYCLARAGPLVTRHPQLERTGSDDDDLGIGPCRFDHLPIGCPGLPTTFAISSPLYIITDVAVLVGYVSVFSVRSPDFTNGLSRTRDLVILINLLCLPVLALMLAGSAIYLGTGETDLVALLASQGASVSETC